MGYTRAGQAATLTYKKPVLQLRHCSRLELLPQGPVSPCRAQGRAPLLGCTGQRAPTPTPLFPFLFLSLCAHGFPMCGVWHAAGLVAYFPCNDEKRLMKMDGVCCLSLSLCVVFRPNCQLREMPKGCFHTKAPLQNASKHEDSLLHLHYSQWSEIIGETIHRRFCVPFAKGAILESRWGFIFTHFCGGVWRRGGWKLVPEETLSQNHSY